MGDQGSSSKGIPSWQLPSSSTSNAEEGKPSQPTEQLATAESHDTKATTDENTESKTTPSSEPLVEQAKRFLDDDSLKDATIQEKITFLQTKGLSSSEIDQALKQSKTGAATSPPSTVAMSTPVSVQQIDTDTRSSRDVPPIITYPEFLMQAQKPPPIITVNRLLNTAYAAAGIGAAIYGISKYLVAPMTESLTSSRHNFATHVKEQLDQLNEKLQGVVSTDANISSNARRKVAFDSPKLDGNDAASDSGSSNSDPTELFHRDFGTQTSSDVAAPTTSSSSSSSDALSDTPSDPIEDHANSLSEISNGITALINDETVSGGSSAELSTALKVLDDYLESLAYPSFSSNHEMGAYGYSYNSNDNDKSKKKDDEIQRMKAEIRSVKGVLLSARNFPGSTGGRRPLYPPTT